MRLMDLLRTPLHIGCLADGAIIAIFNIFAQGKDDFGVPSHIIVNFS